MAARDDLAAGMLSDLRQLVSAEAFGDLLETGAHLLEESHDKANVYDKVMFGEVQAWGKLRDMVDRGDFESPQDIEVGSAKRMIDGVRDFVLRYR